MPMRIDFGPYEGPGVAATRWMVEMECLSAGVARVDGEWAQVMSVGRERSCIGMSSGG
jgi:hypothetical protein